MSWAIPVVENSTGREGAAVQSTHMCGIVGIINSDGVTPKDRIAVERALSLQQHRGPDGSGIAEFPFAVLGHVRLSIIDVSGGAQPMATKDEKFWIVFNGEIYNFQSLREKLIARGVRFRTNSDTEALLYAYREFGPACLDLLNGMFAFAIVDVDRREVFLARDRLGIKPLYYAVDGGRLCFSSELKAFKVLLDHRLELNHEALDCYLATRYVIAPRTLLKNVNKLLPGYFAIWRNGTLEERQYWDIPTNNVGPSDPVEAGSMLKSLLRDAVRLQLISDVPLGVMLSGGLDSTIITSLMYDERGRGIQTFSVATSGGGDWDERPYARLVAERFETEHHEIEIDPQVYLSTLERQASSMDDLVADPAAVLLFYVSKLARQYVTVVLSGEGSDELFAGYSYHLLWKPWNRQRLFNCLPRTLMPAVKIGSQVSSRLEGYMQRYRMSSAEFASEFRGVAGLGLSPAERIGLVQPEVAGYYGQSMYDLTWPFYRNSLAKNIISDSLYADSKTWLPDNLLTKADRMSMANSLELRVPFLDHRLVEFSASLPINFKLRRVSNGCYVNKALLRDAFAEEIPRKILDRKKQGFTLNWQEIVATKGKEMARDILLCGDLDALFQRSQLISIIDSARPEDSHSCQALFSLVLFGLWQREFFD